VGYFIFSHPVEQKHDMWLQPHKYRAMALHRAGAKAFILSEDRQQIKTQ